MRDEVEFWDPNEWEAHVLRLLHDQYGAHNVQKVPAKHKGDCGLDYFCLDKLVVYQCYAVQEPVDVASRAAKQKAKVTTDIGKFCDVTKGAAALFAGYKIKRWILAVPLHDSKDVVAHAMGKTAKVIAKGLPYIDPNFQILVHDREDFDEGSWRLRAQLRKRIRPIVAQPTPEEVTTMIGGEASLADNLRTKLGARFEQAGALEDAVDGALSTFVQSENAKERLRTMAPDAYELVVSLIAQRLRRIRTGSKGTSGVDRLDAEIDALRNSMVQALPNLDASSAELIAFGAVSEWLMRCPLRLD